MLGIAFALLAGLATASEAGTLRGRLTGATKGLDELVVSLAEGATLPPAPFKGDGAMNQLRKRFSPAVVAVATGAAVRFENLDDVFHNVFSLDKRNPFDLGLYKGERRFAEDRRTPAKGAEPAVSFSAAGAYPVFCNIHPDMAGTVYAFDHGYFARADRDGLFELPAPDSGKVTLVVEGPALPQPVRVSVELPRDERLEVPIKPKRLRLNQPHSRKDGSEYGGAYGSRP
ncbi:MAG: hypothetical protein HY553_04730 [Elusimicrobia bacterium]|nr:hypothetical protein [Elusimicrobiota bacterium]